MEIKSFFEAQIERNKQLIIDSNLSEYKIWARKYGRVSYSNSLCNYSTR